MKLRSQIVCRYKNVRAANAVSKSIRPDNIKLPGGLKISTKISGKNVVSKIEMDGKIETLLATLDDLLSCTQTAENVL